MSRLFDRYDGDALLGLFEEVGVTAALRTKGFADFGVSIEERGMAVPHIALRAVKAGATHLLLDACLRRVRVAATLASAAGPRACDPLDLLLVQWVREQDPTACFVPGRPRLPLQRHPGLGVLRHAFRVALRVGGDLGVDGLANQPKFFHDAAIFHRSRLFLFLDGSEQGRFEALARDLAPLPLSDATLAVAGWCLRDAEDRVVRWQPGYQVFPLSDRLTAHFHSQGYAAAVAAARDRERFRLDDAALSAARAALDEDDGEGRAGCAGRDPQSRRRA